MKCLHGEPAALSTTQNGSFWFCGQNPSCNFFCCEGYLYEKAITAWRATKQPHPQCVGHNKLAKMWVVRDLMKASYGRPRKPSEKQEERYLTDKFINDFANSLNI